MSDPPTPRLAPELPLPPYAYVPGRSPHPVSDPRGHSHGARPAPPAAPDPRHWQACRPYLFGLDLFNHGYYWEAHEAWEALWHACGRKGQAADFLKGLIHLAAAGVKLREGKPRGVASHARRAAALFQQTRGQAGTATRYMGLGLGDLVGLSQKLAERRAGEPVGFLLCPTET